jgi:hypothetical protein
MRSWLRVIARIGAISCCLVAFASMPLAVANSAPSVGPPVVGGTAPGGFRLGAHGVEAGDPSTGSGYDGAEPVARVVDCGTPLPLGHVVGTADDPCATTHNSCAGQSAVSETGAPLTTQVTLVEQPNGTWVQTNSDCSVIAGPPANDPAAVRAEFLKLLPDVAVKATPGNGQQQGLVDVEALFWINTPARLNLGTTPLLGHQVAITATVQTVTWSFGDGTTTTSNNPGRAFLETDHCYTLACPDWFGHTYTRTGSMTVTAAVTWSGNYQVVGGAPLDTTGTVTTTATNFPIQVMQAQSVLVTNPPTTH